ncbi:6-phosphogluconolactonase [Pseudoclavibacter sp. 13-3]|uniref:6-phosphogluconolactonase n=1 Tax=Pseudoclavibacter sp. 13-3 TaxID=2901228 RepID=UPI001E5796A6|nr:6-phosphogluconolactonase [Pseudoclavibacter sp. 13-3]MCD7101932.1 6-phosphogluconolactonase [Pseudoclavibacter sp. 13-3]
MAGPDGRPPLTHIQVPSLDAGVLAATETVLRHVSAFTAGRSTADRFDGWPSLSADEPASSRAFNLALTGGTAGSAVTQSLAEHAEVDWSQVHLWYGDERWVTRGSAERNDVVALDARHRRAAFAEAELHRIAAADDGLTVEGAASAYAVDLAANVPVRDPQSALPALDLVLLGVGPDGHVASIFPDHQSAVAGSADSPASTIAVRSSPKPPPTRVSLTLSTIRAARHVVLIACGDEKRAAVRGILGDAPLPAALARGRRSTLLISTPQS